MAEYENRGGTIEIRNIEPSDFAALGREHDLVVVAAGKRSFGEYFGEDPTSRRTRSRSVTSRSDSGTASSRPTRAR